MCKLAKKNCQKCTVVFSCFYALELSNFIYHRTYQAKEKVYMVTSIFSLSILQGGSKLGGALKISFLGCREVSLSFVWGGCPTTFFATPNLS
jgi:hypothetical protein